MKNYLQSKGDEVKKIIRNWGVLNVASVYHHRVLELWEYLCTFTSWSLGISLDCQIFKHRTILALSNWPRFKIQTFTSISKRYHLCIRPVHANCFDRGSNPQGSDWIQWYTNKYLNVTQWTMSSWIWQWIFYHLVKIFFWRSCDFFQFVIIYLMNKWLLLIISRSWLSTKACPKKWLLELVKSYIFQRFWPNLVSKNAGFEGR